MRELEAQLAACFLGPVTVRVGELSASVEALPLEEREVSRGFAPKRQREFATGRTLARRALAAMGQPEVAIPIGPHRAPVWPEGVVGSISHTSELCAVVLASRLDFSSVGLDLEHQDAADEETWSGILTASERQVVEARPAEERRRLATLLLSAKECFHKLQNPLTKVMLDFLEVEIELSQADELEAGGFRVRVEARAPLLLPVRPEGRFFHARGHVWTALGLWPSAG